MYTCIKKRGMEKEKKRRGGRWEEKERGLGEL
jgi:hypothetical protein